MPLRSYTGAEYREAGIGAGPFALESNPDYNFRKQRTRKICGFVVHITVGAEDVNPPDTSAEGTTRYGATTTADASWHVCIDSDSIVPSVRDEYVAWHAGVAGYHFNDGTLGIEIGTNITDWRKKPRSWVEKAIRNVAIWIAPRAIKYNIPRKLVNSRDTVENMINTGRPFGFTSHARLAPHNRRDPGMVGNPPTWTDTFPWDLLFQYVEEEIAILKGGTTKEEDMELTDKVTISAGVKKTAGVSIAQVSVNGALNYGVGAFYISLKNMTSIAELSGQVSALTEAVKQIATGGTIDYAKVEEAATRGTAAAIKAIDVTVVTEDV